MRSGNREVNIFNMALLDILSGALGAFCFLMLALFPYYNAAGAESGDDAESVADENRRLEREVSDLERQKTDLQRENQDLQERATAEQKDNAFVYFTVHNAPDQATIWLRRSGPRMPPEWYGSQPRTPDGQAVKYHEGSASLIYYQTGAPDPGEQWDAFVVLPPAPGAQPRDVLYDIVCRYPLSGGSYGVSVVPGVHTGPANGRMQKMRTITFSPAESGSIVPSSSPAGSPPG